MQFLVGVMNNMAHLLIVELFWIYPHLKVPLSWRHSVLTVWSLLWLRWASNVEGGFSSSEMHIGCIKTRKQEVTKTFEKKKKLILKLKSCPLQDFKGKGRKIVCDQRSQVKWHGKNCFGEEKGRRSEGTGEVTRNGASRGSCPVVILTLRRVIFCI